MANVNIPDLAALTAPAATDEIEVYDASAAANVRLALSYVALTGTANVFTAAQDITLNATGDTQTALVLDNDWGYGASTAGAAIEFWRVGVKKATIHAANENLASSNGSYIAFSTLNAAASFGERARFTGYGHLLIGTLTDAAQLTVNGAMALVDGMTAPGTTSGWAKIDVDSADGDLKVKFGDGTVKTLATDT